MCSPVSRLTTQMRLSLGTKHTSGLVIDDVAILMPFFDELGMEPKLIMLFLPVCVLQTRSRWSRPNDTNFKPSYVKLRLHTDPLCAVFTVKMYVNTTHLAKGAHLWYSVTLLSAWAGLSVVLIESHETTSRTTNIPQHHLVVQTETNHAYMLKLSQINTVTSQSNLPTTCEQVLVARWPLDVEHSALVTFQQVRLSAAFQINDRDFVRFWCNCHEIVTSGHARHCVAVDQIFKVKLFRYLRQHIALSGW